MTWMYRIDLVKIDYNVFILKRYTFNFHRIPHGTREPTGARRNPTVYSVSFIVLRRLTCWFSYTVLYNMIHNNIAKLGKETN